MLEFTSHTDKQVLEHYILFWGEPKRIVRLNETIEGQQESIFVAEFLLDTEDDGTWVYATIGASRQPQTTAEGEKMDRRFELMMYAYHSNSRLMDTLATIAFYPFRHNTYLGSSHTIAGTIGRSIVDDSPLTDILLFDPVKEPQDFQALHLDNKHHVDILWVVALYRSERLYKVEHGLEALVNLFSENEIDPADFFRAPVV